LESLPRVEIISGDIRDDSLLEKALRGIDVVYHLAALLPPNSERDRNLTWEINVGGTEKLLYWSERTDKRPRIIFASSVSTYGDTSRQEPPISVDHPQRPLDIYGESKVAGEDLVRKSSLPWTILRISGIAIPAFLDPPDVWPFRPEQRVEFIALGDLVTCLTNLLEKEEEVRRKVMNVAGGKSWQVTGGEYVRRYYQTMDLPLEQARYLDSPGWLDWYDTEESQRILQYQNTSFDKFHQLLAQAVADALAE